MSVHSRVAGAVRNPRQVLIGTEYLYVEPYSLPAGPEFDASEYLYVESEPIIADDFTGTDGTDLHGRTPNTQDVGTTWETVRGAWSIAGNKARATGTVSPTALLMIDGGVTQFEFVASVAPEQSVPDGLMFRYVDLNNYWRAEVSAQWDRLYLIKCVAGVETIVTGNAVSFTSLVSYVINIHVIGNVINAYANGVLINTTTDSAHAAATKVGFIAGSTTGRWDWMGLYTFT